MLWFGAPAISSSAAEDAALRAARVWTLSFALRVLGCSLRWSTTRGGPPFHPRLPTWSDSTVRSWDQAEPETADLSDFVALARHSGSDGRGGGGDPFPPSRGDVDTRGQGRIVPGLLGESPRA